jgi:hypothetical protein
VAAVSYKEPIRAGRIDELREAFTDGNRILVTFAAARRTSVQFKGISVCIQF